MKLAVSLRIGCLILVAFGAPAYAANPSLGNIMPRGGQRGTDVEVQFQGDRLLDAQEVLLYQPGVTVKSFEVVNNNAVKVVLTVAPDCRLGEHSMRVRCTNGISDLRTFWVGALPVINETEPNTDFKAPQKIATNVTVHGVVENEDEDYFLIEAKKGERISAEIEGLRLGNTLFDSFVSIMDMDRFDLATSDDSALLLQDPVASVVAPADGTYVIRIRETSYGGNGGCLYRLHVGTFPRPRTIFPAGGKAGDDLNVTFLGDVLGPMPQSIKVPADNIGQTVGLFAEQNGQISPSPCRFRVADYGNVVEAEPNNDQSTASRYDGELPIAFNGVIAEDKDIDWFRFKAKKGQTFDINVFARRVRSPLDSILVVCNAQGGGIASNDDSGGPDSYLRFTVPEDGEYTLYVHDQLMRGYVDGTYRVEITPVKPTLTLSIPLTNPNPAVQERQVIVVPKGNRFTTLVRATRADFGGEVTLEAPELPQGVTLAAENVHPNLDVVPVVFEAAPDAPVGSRLVLMSAKPADPNLQNQIKGVFAQPVSLVIGLNNTSFYDARVDRLAVAVADEVPFKIQVQQPKVPIVLDGQYPLKVTCERKDGFTAPINVRMVFDPPGVGSGQAQIPGDKNETTIPLNANGGATVKRWKIAVLGWTDVPAATPADANKPAGTNPGGTVWVSSQLAELEVAPHVFTGTIDLAATEQGKPAQVLVKLENKTPFEGEATLKLVGLPNGCASDERKIKATDKEVIFNVTTDAKTTPVGQHNTLFCQLVLPKEGEEIVQSLAGGGVLRVDAPPPPKADAPPMPEQPAAQPAPEQPTERPLSRLEKLRLEQQQKQGGK